MVALNDIVASAQRRVDRVNANTITTAEWLDYAYGSLQELYGMLCSTYEDYNIKQYQFTLVGGAQGQNQIGVGPGTSVPDFYQPRAIWVVLSGATQPFLTIPRLESFQERNLWVYPTIVPVYGSIPTRWSLMGNQLEILPPTVAGQSYILWYVPTLPNYIQNPGDPIDSNWVTINGWHEYAVLDTGIKALLKEESTETAQVLMVQKSALAKRIVEEARPRDISGPKSIVDMSRVRNPWGVFGGGWNGGGSWQGGNGDGSGFW